MDKRVILALGLALATLALPIEALAQPAAKSATPTATTPTIAKPAAPADKPTATTDKPITGMPPAADSPAVPAKIEPKESVLELAGHYRAIFTNFGAAPLQWILLNPQYKEDNPRKSNKLSQPMDLVKTLPPALPVVFSFAPADGLPQLPVNAVWNEEDHGSDSVVYSAKAGDLKITKRYQSVPESYEVRLTVTVENLSDKPLSFYPRMAMYGWHDPAQKSSSMFSRRVSQTEGLCLIDGKVKKANLEAILKASPKSAVDETNNKLHWIGVGGQYFVMAAALKLANDGRRCEVGGQPDGTINASLTLDKQTAPAHGSLVYEWTLYMGPKVVSKLDAVTVGGQDAEMGKAVDYGWTEAVARPMLGVLKAIHAVVPNWGAAIIILTILLKMLTWWPTQKSMKSMKSMAKLKPEMDKLKERYGDDKNAMNVAMMDLYKKHEINPLGGCLPVLIQMPIYIALYAMLGNSVELYRSGFFGWIKDLTSPDPFYVLPVVTGLLMFVQQKTQPAPADPQQQTMMYIMPVMMTAFGVFLPAGLTIYILTNTVLTFVQQFLMNRGEPKRT